MAIITGLLEQQPKETVAKKPDIDRQPIHRFEANRRFEINTNSVANYDVVGTPSGIFIRFLADLSDRDGWSTVTGAFQIPEFLSLFPGYTFPNDPGFLGERTNTVLIQLEPNLYLQVDDPIKLFRTSEQILRYDSFGGPNTVPYPIARGENFDYILYHLEEVDVYYQFPSGWKRTLCKILKKEDEGHEYGDDDDDPVVRSSARRVVLDRDEVIEDDGDPVILDRDEIIDDDDGSSVDEDEYKSFDKDLDDAQAAPLYIDRGKTSQMDMVRTFGFPQVEDKPSDIEGLLGSFGRYLSVDSLPLELQTVRLG
jgi:hypothetical protein